MSSWVGPWVPFSKLSRQKAIETAEILLEQRDKQIRRAESAEARLAAVEAVCEDHEPWTGDEAEFIADIRAAARGEGDPTT